MHAPPRRLAPRSPVALQAAAIEPPPDRGKWFAFRADNVHVIMRPDSALAWIGVGMTYVGSDDVAPGITAVQRAQALDPREANATRVLQALQEHQQRMAINAALASAQAGKLIDALVTLDQTIPNITNEKLLQIARKLREDVAKLASRR